MTKAIYILVADSSQAIIYAKIDHENTLTEIRHFECLNCKLHNIDLVSDKPGRVTQQSGKRAKGLSTHQSPKDREVEIFAKSLCDFLNKARKENKFDELILAAPPKFLGVLHKKLNTETSKMIRQNINKNLLKKSGEIIMESAGL